MPPDPLASPQPTPWDEAAFEALFHAHYRRLFRFAQRYLTSEADARDLVGDVFLELWAHRATIGSGSSLDALLYTITRRRALNALRLRRRRLAARWATADGTIEGGVEASIGLAPEPTAPDDRDLLAAVDHATARLPERARQVFLLAREHQMSYEDIARVLDISVRTVGAHMRRAFAELRVALAPYRPSDKT